MSNSKRLSRTTHYIIRIKNSNGVFFDAVVSDELKDLEDRYYSLLATLGDDKVFLVKKVITIYDIDPSEDDDG